MAKKQTVVGKLLGTNKPEEEFMGIGGSPMLGITLQQVLNGHTGQIHQLAWSPNGKILASASQARLYPNDTCRKACVEREKR